MFEQTLCNLQVALWKHTLGNVRMQRIWSFIAHIQDNPEKFVLTPESAQSLTSNSNPNKPYDSFSRPHSKKHVPKRPAPQPKPSFLINEVKQEVSNNFYDEGGYLKSNIPNNNEELNIYEPEPCLATTKDKEKSHVNKTIGGVKYKYAINEVKKEERNNSYHEEGCLKSNLPDDDEELNIYEPEPFIASTKVNKYKENEKNQVSNTIGAVKSKHAIKNRPLPAIPGQSLKKIIRIPEQVIETNKDDNQSDEYVNMDEPVKSQQYQNFDKAVQLKPHVNNISSKINNVTVIENNVELKPALVTQLHIALKDRNATSAVSKKSATEFRAATSKVSLPTPPPLNISKADVSRVRDITTRNDTSATLYNKGKYFIK